MKMRKTRTIKTYLIFLIIVLTTAACIFLGPRPQNTPTPVGEPEIQGDSRLTAALSVPETVPRCDPIDLEFKVTIQFDQAVYLLNWYTPLEGILGDIFQVTYNGEELSYLGPQVMRAAPLPEQYILLEAGGSATAMVDISTAYDFSNAGLYTISFKPPLISHVVENTSDFATAVDELGPVQMSSSPVEVEIVVSENGEGDCTTSIDAPPAASDQGHPDFPLITLTGIVKDVSPSSRIIWLQEEVDGFTAIALLPESTITNASGNPLELAQIQQGLTVRASGQPGDNQALLAHSMQVIPPVKPAAIPNMVMNHQSEADSSTNQSEIPENVLPTVTPSKPQGYLMFPYQSADAGNFFLQAGEDILITWGQAPQGAETYTFIYKDSDDGVSQTIGIDDDGLNGVAATMNVPEHLNGQFIGLARFENGDQIWSPASTVYSGEFPPANVCSIQANGVGVVNVYLNPEMNSPRFTYLIPGTYATVIKKIADDWYLIDASVAIDSTENIAAQGEGWVNAGSSSISLHGLCNDIPNGK